MKTYWNGEECKARIVRIIVSEPPIKNWWFADLVGTEREAVEVNYTGKKFYIDNEDGSGWKKVTEGKGSPWYGHKSIMAKKVIEMIAVEEEIIELKDSRYEIKLKQIAGQFGIKNGYQFQKFTGLSESVSYSLWRGGLKTINLKLLNTLCNLFNCTPNDILELTPQEK